MTLELSGTNFDLASLPSSRGDNKTLRNSKTQKNILKRIPSSTIIKTKNNKYDNSVLFALREQSFKEKELKRALIKQRQRSQAVLPIPQHKSTLYLTDNIQSTTRDSEEIINTGPSTSLLKNIVHERQLEKNKVSHKEENVQLDRKHKTMNLAKKINIREYLNKTRELILMKYTAEIKKERALRLQESYNNEIESINDSIKSMQQAKKLFNDDFLSKYNEYVKHLAIQKEEEKIISENLYNKIILLKKDIAQLEAKKNRIESDKIGLERWMYFQIQIKEKKIALPPYYKTILDTPDLCYESDDTELFTTAIKRNLLKQISLEEYNRVKLYKNKLLFNDEEFLEQFQKFENKNIKLIFKYNLIANEVVKLKSEKIDLKDKSEKYDETITHDILVKQSELNQLTSRYNQLLKDKNSLIHLTHSHSSSNISINKKRNQNVLSEFNMNSRGIKGRIYQTKLHSKIIELYESAMEVPGIKKPIIRSDYEMLFLLGKIENALDVLLEKNRVLLNGPLAVLYKEIQVELDKDRKVKKTKMQREAQMKKIEYLKAKIEERNNKIHFLPLRKVDYGYIQFSKKDKIELLSRKENKIPQFEDFMFDVDNNTFV